LRFDVTAVKSGKSVEVETLANKGCAVAFDANERTWISKWTICSPANTHTLTYADELDWHTHTQPFFPPFREISHLHQVRCATTKGAGKKTGKKWRKNAKSCKVSVNIYFKNLWILLSLSKGSGDKQQFLPPFPVSPPHSALKLFRQWHCLPAFLSV